MERPEPFRSSDEDEIPRARQLPSGLTRGPPIFADGSEAVPSWLTESEPLMPQMAVTSWVIETATVASPDATSLIPLSSSSLSPSSASPISNPTTSNTDSVITPTGSPLQTTDASGVFTPGMASSSSAPSSVAAPSTTNSNNTTAIAVGVTVPVVVLIIIALVAFLWWKQKWPFKRRTHRGPTESMAGLNPTGRFDPYADAENQPAMTQYNAGAFVSQDPTPREIGPDGTFVPGAAATAAARMAESERRWGSGGMDRSITNETASTNRTNKSFKSSLLAGLGKSVFGKRRPGVYPEVAYLYDPPIKSETNLPAEASTTMKASTGQNQPLIKKEVISGPLPIMTDLPVRSSSQTGNQNQSAGQRPMSDLNNYILAPPILRKEVPGNTSPQAQGQPQVLENVATRDYATQPQSGIQKGPSVTEHPIFKSTFGRPELDRNSSSMSTIPVADPSKERVPIMLDQQSIPSPTAAATVAQSTPPILSTALPPVGRRENSHTPSDSTIVASSHYSSPPSVSPQSPPSPATMQRPQPRLITSFDDPSNKKVSVISPASPLLPTAVSETVREATTAYFSGRRHSKPTSVPRVSVRKPTPSTGSPVSVVAPLSPPSLTTSPRLSRKHRRTSTSTSLDKPLPALPKSNMVPEGTTPQAQAQREPEAEPAWHNWRDEVEREAARIWAPK